MSGKRDYTKFEQKILANIDKSGWHANSILADGDAPGFTYSVGFTKTLGCPEFIVFGLPSSLSFQMLSRIYEQIGTNGIPADGQRWSDVLEGHDCVSRDVHPSNIVRDYLNSAMWYARDRGQHAPLEAAQLFWPAVNTILFPWDPDCPDDVKRLQPLLYRPNRRLM